MLLDATRVPSENKTLAPVKYHQHPRTPADLLTVRYSRKYERHKYHNPVNHSLKGFKLKSIRLPRIKRFTLRTQNTKATGYYAQLKPNPQGVVQLFALLLAEQIVLNVYT